MKIIYPIAWDEQDNIERPCKGWLSGVVVQMEDGKEFSLTFYDPVRLQQDLAVGLKNGEAAIVEKGLIVVPEVTKVNIERAIVQAANEGYFK